MPPLEFRHELRTFWCVFAFAISGDASLLAVSGPPLRTGLWMTQPIEGGDKAGAFEAQVRANPHLSGVCLHIGWCADVMLMGMSLVAHARFVPLHPHDKYLTFIVNGMRFDENNPYIIRECIVQVLHARFSRPHKCPLPRRARRSPNHFPRVVDVQSSAKEVSAIIVTFEMLVASGVPTKNEFP